ncbi:hypothetical protein D9M71_254280 [compost metagenome]
MQLMQLREKEIKQCYSFLYSSLVEGLAIFWQFPWLTHILKIMKTHDKMSFYS